MTSHIHRRTGRRGHMAYLGTGGFRSTDYTRDVLRAQLYMSDERAPWGWEKRGLNG